MYWFRYACCWIYVKYYMLLLWVSEKMGWGDSVPEDMIMIPKKEYERLLDDSNFLDCLEICGVDNWSGYEDAFAMNAEIEAERESDE